ncbi:hypothetical protein [Nocardioides sp.]|uniref:hypothetical protein n=1 Tax=Nocardioides sp. TaxID=35761 RepID=UPI003569417C
MVPTREPDDPRLAAIQLRRELIADGLDDRAITRLVRAGVLHRARYGAYVDAGAWARCDDVGRHELVARAVLKSAKTEVVLSHLSALAVWEVPIWDLALGPVHITRVDQRAGRREAGVVQHLGELRPSDTVTVHGIRLTSATRTALDCVPLVGIEHGMAIVGDLLHRNLTTPTELEEGRRFMERWPGTLAMDVVLRLADGRCESPGEHRALHLCWQQHLPAPIPQYVVRDRAGLVVARLDFAWPELGVFMEFDGKVKYQSLLREGESPSDAVIREKQREELIRELTGWRCIRITWADLYKPEATAARIRALMHRGQDLAS